VSWRAVVLIVLALTGTAGFVAVDFAANMKEHVVLHMFLAYSLVWSLLALYGRSHRRHRRFACTLLWLTAASFLAFLCYIHWDDVDGRVIMSEQGWIHRPRAPLLWAALGLDGAAALVWTAHALFLGWGNREKPEPVATGEPAAVESTDPQRDPEQPTG
jgi:hypothetical protein